LRQEAHVWLQYVGSLLRRPVGLKAHQDLLVSGGWLALLAGCVEYDLGMRSAAESTRTAAMLLGLEAGHPEIAGWGHEMAAWFALTQGRTGRRLRQPGAGRPLRRGAACTFS
jgi:hypothetical protein